MAEELSLVIENPHEGEFLKHIEWNKTEFMELVASITEQYEGLAYTEDQMKTAKSDRARLNAMKKKISDRRIQVKKAVMEPYTAFEAEVAEVTALIDKPISIIDGQIKEYEERVKTEKRDALKGYFEEIAADLEGILTFDRVFDQRYLNISVSLDKAKEDIRSKVERVHTGLESLEGFCNEKYLAIAKDKYFQTLSVSDALAEARRMEEFERRAEEERRRREEEAEAARLAAEATESESSQEETVVKKAEETSDTLESSTSIDVPETAPTAPEQEAKLCKASFTVYGTKAQIMALRDYMVQHNIKFGKVEK